MAELNEFSKDMMIQQLQYIVKTDEQEIQDLVLLANVLHQKYQQNDHIWVKRVHKMQTFVSLN